MPFFLLNAVKTYIKQNSTYGEMVRKMFLGLPIWWVMHLPDTAEPWPQGSESRS